MSTLKIFAALLHYPDAALQAHADELEAVLDAEGLMRGARRDAIVGFIHQLRDQDLLERQAEYVETFDRGRSRSLHLYEHVHGESRDRGQAMVELTRVYREHGFEITSAELPDYLPLFLEFLSTLPMADAMDWLEEVGPILQRLHARLVERSNPYAVLIEPLVRLGGLSVDASLREEVAKEARDDTPEALDRVWMEDPVTFGPDDACGTARQPREQKVQWYKRPPSA